MTLLPFSSPIKSTSQWGYGISSTCTSYVTWVILRKTWFGKATCHDKTSFERYSHIVSPRSLCRVKIQTSRWRYLVITLHLCQHFSVHQFLLPNIISCMQVAAFLAAHTRPESYVFAVGFVSHQASLICVWTLVDNPCFKTMHVIKTFSY